MEDSLLHGGVFLFCAEPQTKPPVSEKNSRDEKSTSQRRCSQKGEFL